MKPALERAKEAMLLAFLEAEEPRVTRLLQHLGPPPGVKGWGEKWLAALIQINIIWSQMVETASKDPNLEKFRKTLRAGKSLTDFQDLLSLLLEEGLNQT